MYNKRSWSPASRGEKNLLMGNKQPRRSYSLYATARSHRGLLRANNEDNLYFNGAVMPLETMDDGCSLLSASKDSWQVFAVFDGMGGEKAGELASFATAQVFREVLSQKPIDATAAIRDAVRLANQRVLDIAHERNVGRMGTTLAVLYISDGKASVANIGDSRVYLMRSGHLTQLTEDQTDACRKLKMGLITAEQALHDKGRHVLTQHIGIDPEEMELAPVFSAEIILQDADTFLLCSDGLYDIVDDATIEESMKGGVVVESITEALVDTALALKARDNVTVIVIKVKSMSVSDMLMRAVGLNRRQKNI